MPICLYERVSVLLLVVLLSACGGGESPVTSAPVVKVSIQNEAPLSACASGGITINSGVDINNDLVLQTAEITAAQYVCNGANGAIGAAGVNGINGTNGLAGTGGSMALVLVSTELPGKNCTAGGSQVSAGLDKYHDQILVGSEVTSSNFICHGASGLDGSGGHSGANGTDGTRGSDGAAGPTGLKSLIAIVTELPGLHCMTGGVVSKSGVDSDSSNVLDAWEVSSTTYICNGERGATGITGATGSAGANGVDGAKGDTGAAGGIGAYGYIYALNRQEVAIDAAVLFDAQTDLLNIEHQLDSSVISILQDGNYLVSFSITGTEPNQFAIFVNGVVVPGSVYGSGAGTQQNHGQVIVGLRQKDTVTLVNFHSAAAVGLQSNSGGTEKNVVASVTLLKLSEIVR
jgi:hypothetical protein